MIGYDGYLFYSVILVSQNKVKEYLIVLYIKYLDAYVVFFGELS